MNVYDFDRTIYSGYCSIHFWKYCVKKHPSVLRVIPKATVAILRYKMKRCTWGEVTERFFGFLRYLPTIEQIVEDFWNQNIEKIYDWYLEQKADDDVIISAAPDFLISSVCKRLGVKCVATDMDMVTGKINGMQCDGEEKAKRYYNEFGDTPIDEFYSDSFSDLPLARLARQAFMVDEGTISEWNIEATV